MNKRFNWMIGIATVLLAVWLAVPAYGQVRIEDLGFQNKAVEPGDGTAMAAAGCTPADLGSGVTIMRFKITDVDPQADDPSDVRIEEITVDNLGTATPTDIIEVLLLDQDGNCDQLGGGPVAPIAGPNPNIPFTATFLTNFTLPDDQMEFFEVAVRTANTTVLLDDSQRHTLVLRVTVKYNETVGSPPTNTDFTGVVTDGAPEFIWNGGINELIDDTVIINPLMPGQQGLVSRFTACDNDSNEHNIIIDSLNIKQGDLGTALFTDIATIKVFRVENNTRTMVGTLTPTAAWDRGGPGDTLLLPTAVFLLDDHCTVFEIEAQVSPFAFKGKLIQMEFQLSTEEPVGTAISQQVDAEVKTHEATVIGKGLIEIPDALVIGPAGDVLIRAVGIPLPGLGTLQVGPTGFFGFDPRVIQIKDIVGVGNYIVDAHSDINEANRTGQFAFTVRIDPAQAGNALQTGTLAVIKVQAVGAAGQRSRLNLIFDKVTNANNIEISNDVGTDAGQVKIVPPGDVDGDGRTTIADALLVASQLILSTPCSGLSNEQKLIADVATPKAAADTIPTCGGTSPTLTSADVAEIARLALTAPTGSSVAVTATGPTPLALQSILTASRGGILRVQAQGSGIAALKLELFSMSGQRLLSQAAAGSQLFVRMQSSSGAKLANGVYLYVVTVVGKNGQIMHSPVYKLVVLR